MKVGLRCVVCDREGEDGGHLFFGCKTVKEIWRCAGLEHMRLRLAECQNAMEVVKLILAINGDARLQFLFLMSNWWHERNAIREGEQRRSATYLANLCWKQTQELKALHSPMQALHSSMHRVG